MPTTRSVNGLSGLDALVAAAAAAGHELDERLCRQAWQLYRDDPEQAAARSAPEYGKREYLLSVDRRGEPVHLPAATVSQLADAIACDPGLAAWFQPAALPGSGEPTLLPARWLCHLIGLRHRTVHLFLDHPTLPGHTLIQVRGVDKEEAPGCFDLPVAGHVEALDTLPATLQKEMQEELGLMPDALEELAYMGAYERAHTVRQADLRNVEYHVVYRARLGRAAWLDLCAAGDEVAAIAIFALGSLGAMMARFPERFASGLLGSWPLYATSHNRGVAG